METNGDDWEERIENPNCVKWVVMGKTWKWGDNQGTVIAMLRYFKGYNEEDEIDSFGIKGASNAYVWKP